MGLSIIIPCSFSSESLSQKRLHLFSFLIRIKTPFHKNITDDSEFFFTELECIGITQIIHMEETETSQRAIGLLTSTYGLQLFHEDFSKYN